MVFTKLQTMSNFENTKMNEEWAFINKRFGGMSTDADKEAFIADLKAVAAGREITHDRFIVAHAMWHGDGVIHPGIFSDDQATVMQAIQEGGCGTFPTVSKFIHTYLYKW